VIAEKYARKELLNLPRRIRFDVPRDVINLGVGDPDFNQPKFVAEELAKAVLEGYTHYSFGGDPEFKREIARYYEKFGVKINPESQVILTSGAIGALFRVMAALINPGDQVVIPDPAFTGYISRIVFFGGEVVRAPMRKLMDGSFKPNIESIRRAVTDRTKLIIICNPDNPTGCMYTRSELEELVEIAAEKDALILSDEIYVEFAWKNRHVTLMEIPEARERTIIVMSFSKTFAWTGLRVGFIITSPEIAEIIRRVPIGVSPIPTPIQRAAIAMLRRGWKFVDEMKREYEKRIDFAVKRLNEIPGFKCPRPEATFYLFPDISGTKMSSEEYARKLAKEAKVLVSPGSRYGSMGEGHIRIALVKPINVLEEAINRIEKFNKEILK